jgi:hypothetical protein
VREEEPFIIVHKRRVTANEATVRKEQGDHISALEGVEEGFISFVLLGSSAGTKFADAMASQAVSTRDLASERMASHQSQNNGVNRESSQDFAISSEDPASSSFVIVLFSGLRYRFHKHHLSYWRRTYAKRWAT